jgi:ribonuclease J
MVASETKVPQPTVEAGMRVYFNRAFEKPKYERISQLFQTNRIALNEILAEPAKYVMVFRPSMTKLDFAGQLPALCRCLYSYWAGYLKNPDWVELQERVAQAKGDFVPAHTSGHIYIKDLIQLVKALDPKRIVPIHTFEPQAFQSHFNNVQVLDDGQSFQVG